MQSDAEIIEAVLTGRRQAFADLVRRYESTVHAVAMAVLRDHHAAQDVCQETFVAAYRSLVTLRQRDSFGAWIVRLARNEALTFLRLKRPEIALGDVPEPPSHDGDNPLDPRAERLLAAVMRLREDERAVVLLKYIAGHTLEEISHMTHRPVGTVGAQLYRARAHLRESLEEVKR